MTMPEKDPANWSALTWILVIGAGVAGGYINWYTKFRITNKRHFNALELIGELTSSALLSLGTYMLLESYFPVGVCIAAGGIAGHMGTRLLFAVESAFEKWLDSKIPNNKLNDSNPNNKEE